MGKPCCSGGLLTRDDVKFIGSGHDAVEWELPDGVDVLQDEAADLQLVAVADAADRPFDLMIDATAGPDQAQAEVFSIWAPCLPSRGICAIQDVKSEQDLEHLTAAPGPSLFQVFDLRPWRSVRTLCWRSASVATRHHPVRVLRRPLLAEQE